MKKRKEGERREKGGLVLILHLCSFLLLLFLGPLLLMNLIVWFGNISPKASLSFPSVLRLSLADLQINL